MAKIAIVNEHDEVIGASEMAEARQLGQIHRITRILIFDAQGRLLLQKRSAKMKDSPNKWDFSVAGHVDEGEDYQQAALREAREEIGLELAGLKPLAKFYTDKVKDGDRVRRFNTVFIATTNQELHPDSNEVAEVRWFSRSELDGMVERSPQDFTTTFVAKYSELSRLTAGIFY
ncbi:MAG TPA: NUDIX domain-containing protein [Patescibacteria group bacterium]|nr:NUDIX domain-containing protein [Patescibacteria group bacterium]